MKDDKRCNYQSLQIFANTKSEESKPFEAGKRLCEKFFMKEAQRPQTGFAKRRKVSKSRTQNINILTQSETQKSGRLQFHQKQMMFHDCNLVKVRELNMNRPMTGVPFSRPFSGCNTQRNVVLNVEITSDNKNLNDVLEKEEICNHEPQTERKSKRPIMTTHKEARCQSGRNSIRSSNKHSSI